MVNKTRLTRRHCGLFINEGKLKGNSSCMGDNRSRYSRRQLFQRRKNTMIMPNVRHHVDYLHSRGDVGQGQEFTHLSPLDLLRPTPVSPRGVTRRSVLVDEEHKLVLQKQFVSQNAALLSLACLGALLLMSVNLVGILCCKGYFKKKAKPIPVVATYPRTHTSFLSRRHFANLRKYSLEGNAEAASVIDEIRERNIRDDPILGKYPNLGDVCNRPVTISCGTIYSLRQPPQTSNVKVTTSGGIEMTELDTFGVDIDELDVDRSRIGSGCTTWKDKLRKFHFRKKSFREKTEKANTTGYFC